MSSPPVATLVRPLAVLTLLVVSGCAYSALSTPSAEALQSAPPTVVTSGATLLLEAQLLRDSRSPAPAEGQPLTAVMRLVTQDGAPPPATLLIEAVFIVFDGAVWASRVSEVRETDDGDTEYVVEGGPRWSPGTQVDVVARVLPRGGQAFLLRAPDQRVQSTN